MTGVIPHAAPSPPRRRSDAGRVRLQQRDLDGLLLIADHYAARLWLQDRPDTRTSHDTADPARGNPAIAAPLQASNTGPAGPQAVPLRGPGGCRRAGLAV
ncbi:MAG TPA: hypothetical protein VGD91_12115 [Trebonia sp.]